MRDLYVGVLLIVGIISAARGEEPTYAMKLEAIQTRHKEAFDRYSKNFATPKTDAETKVLVEDYNGQVQQNAGDVLAVCRANTKNPANVEALGFVIKIARAGPSDCSKQALEMLIRDHVQTPGIGRIVGWTFFLYHLPVAEQLLREVSTKHPDRQERVWAASVLGSHLEYQAKMVRRFHDKLDSPEEFEQPRRSLIEQFLHDKPDAEALERDAASVYEKNILEYGDLTEFDGGKRTITEADGGRLFALRRLGIGKPAPDIVGQDVDGKPLRLSDYRGKVVVLTFSGNWCGPCKAMYPQERSMVVAMKGRPFALISVNTDDTLDTVKKSITEGEITWPCWFDGGTEGPITTTWGVTAFPSIFVLDENGIVRHKNLRENSLQEAVEKLVVTLENDRRTARPTTERP